MAKKLTLANFIKNAKEIHGNKYDYSQVIYINSRTKVKIYCKKCKRYFEQLPFVHCRGNGCKHCGTERAAALQRSNSIDFIKKAKNIHGDKYSYDKVKYFSSEKKVKIFCNKCKKYFFQTPNKHLNNQGCPYCADNIKKDTGWFIKSAKKIHKNKYNYDKTEYVDAHKKVKIFCNKCKQTFLQLPSAHLRGQGCPYCFGVNKYNLQQFIERCQKIHGEQYDYTQTEYKGQRQKILICCNKCKRSFWQMAEKHMRGQGCPYCNCSKGEKHIEEWLMSHDIRFVSQKIFKDCKDERYLPFDFYLIDYDLCIEFQGKQHYNPQFFINIHKSKSIGLVHFKKQKKHDRIKKNYCKKRKIKLIEISYNMNIDKALAELFK